MRGVARYGREVNTHDLVKVFAITVMIIDHVGLYLLDNEVWFRIIGRLAAPLFFFLVGYSTSNYFRRDLFVLGGLLFAVNFFFDEPKFILNILLNFICIKFVLSYWESLPYYENNEIEAATGIRLETDNRLVMVFLGLAFGNLLVYNYLEYGLLGLSYAIAGVLVRTGHDMRVPWIICCIAQGYMIERTILEPQGLELVLLMAVYLFIGFIFYTYRFATVHVADPWRRFLIHYSRLSLEIYVIHLVILKIFFGVDAIEFDRAWLEWIIVII